jgi:hypothetical protein
MISTGNPENYSGLPVVVVSEGLPIAHESEFCGLRIVPLSAQTFIKAFESAASSILSADILAAFVTNSQEKTALEDILRRRGGPLPPVFVNPTRTEATLAVAEALAIELGGAAVREADLRQALQSMRQEAEETRSALVRLHNRAAEGILAQSLAVVCGAEPVETEVVFLDAFDFSITTQVDIEGLSAVALHFEGRNLSQDDALVISLVGVERSETLGCWIVPASDIPMQREWLMLDLPVSIGRVRQTASILVAGRLRQGGAVAFTGAGQGMTSMAYRLYAAKVPRLVASPFWFAAPGTEEAGDAVSIPVRAWTRLKLFGAGAVHIAASGTIELRLQGGVGAMLVFPEVPLAGVSVIAVRLKIFGEENVTAAVAATAMVNWSAPQRVHGEATVSLTLATPPTVAHIAVSLRADDIPSDETKDIRCLGVWLLRRPRTAPLAAFAAAVAPARLSDAFFEDVVLDETFAAERYRHLDVTILSLTAGRFAWRKVKFKLFEYMGAAGLEFRHGPEHEAGFLSWPAATADEFGLYFKISGSAAEAIASLPEAIDRRLLEAIRDRLPAVIRALASRAAIGKTEAAAWLALARSLCIVET